jgi:hypothetical protein
MIVGRAVTTWAQVEVNTCGQAFSGAGFLSADLDCTGFTGGPLGAAVMVGKRGTLDLRGFTLTGGDTGIACAEPCRKDPSATCVVPCTIIGGGGVVTGAALYGIAGYKVSIANVTVSNVADRGISAQELRLTDSTVTGNGHAGVAANRVKILRSVITGNRGVGVVGSNLFYHGVMTIRDSVVIDNNVGTDCGQLVPCCDLISSWKPRLKNTTCNTSCDCSFFGGGVVCVDWNICRFD